LKTQTQTAAADPTLQNLTLTWPCWVFVIVASVFFFQRNIAIQTDVFFNANILIGGLVKAWPKAGNSFTYYVFFFLWGCCFRLHSKGKRKRQLLVSFLKWLNKSQIGSQAIVDKLNQMAI